MIVKNSLIGKFYCQIRVSLGGIIAKEMWLDMEGGLVKELTEIIHARNCGVMIHNCGQKIYFDEQIQMMNPCAISFLHIPNGCKDFEECKKKYGKDITLIGCVPPPMVVLSTDEEWDAECKRQIDIFAKGGGFILATGCEYPSGSNFDKARRMIKIAKEYGRY